MLSPFNQRVVDAYKSISAVISVSLDSPGDELQRRGRRYTIEYDVNDVAARENIIAASLRLREDEPDFAWNLADVGKTDDWPRTCLWHRYSVSHISSSEVINIKQQVWLTMESIPEVVDVTVSPKEQVRRGEQVNVTVVLRVSMHNPPVDILREVDRRMIQLRRTLPEIVEAQAAPELNFPPTSARLDDPNDPHLDLKGEVMRLVEPYRFLIAAYFDPTPTPPHVYLFGEDATKLLDAVRAVGVTVSFVANPSSVPRAAKCLFNDVTRLCRATAEGNAELVEELRARINSVPQEYVARAYANAAERRTGPAVVKPRGEGLMVGCRWCNARIPASTNPAYQHQCHECGALQAATTLPTKNPVMPLISVFMNPDHSVYVEFVFAPPAPNRWDLSRVLRYVINANCAEEFEQHPMGKRTVRHAVDRKT